MPLDPSLPPRPLHRSEEPLPNGLRRASVFEEGVGGVVLTHRAPGLILAEVSGRLRLPLWATILVEFQRALDSGRSVRLFADLRAYQALDPPLRERIKAFHRVHGERFGPACCLVSTRIGAMITSVISMALPGSLFHTTSAPTHFFASLQDEARKRGVG